MTKYIKWPSLHKGAFLVYKVEIESKNEYRAEMIGRTYPLFSQRLQYSNAKRWFNRNYAKVFTI